MSAITEKTVRDVVLENPAAFRLFEKLGIDYCCGGGATLRQACETARVPLAEVLGSLDAAARAVATAPPPQDWGSEPLGELVAHIQQTHHRYVREEIARLGPLFDKVGAAHAANHPELARLREIFAGLAEELTTHLMKEEMMLFPYVVRLEEAAVSGDPVLPSCFGSVRNPVQMMMQEHDGAGQALRRLRHYSQGYTAPADACLSFRELYRALGEFEADLHQHIHLENNILFPRAVEMESARG